MKVNGTINFLRTLGLVSALSLGFGACSSSQQEGEAELANTNNDEAIEANDENALNEEENGENALDEEENLENEELANEENVENNEEVNLAENNSENLVEQSEDVTNTAPIEADNMEELTMNQGTTEAAPVAMDSGRVVRFVNSDNVAVYSEANSSASAVASMRKGDAVVVSLNGEWAMVAEGRYIAATDLSEMAVGRAKASNNWR